MVECLDGLARITSKELAITHFVKNGTLQNACSPRPRVVADLGKSARMRIARLMNSRQKGPKSAVAMLKKHLDDVFRLKVDKGERTAAYMGRFRELFEKAAREGMQLPDVARGYLMVRAWVRNARLSFWQLQDNRTRSETLQRLFVPLFRSIWV